MRHPSLLEERERERESSKPARNFASQTKWRVYLPSFCNLEFPGHVQKQQQRRLKKKSIGCQSSCTILGPSCASSI